MTSTAPRDLNGFTDLAAGMRAWRTWALLAIEDYRVRYHRTLIGPLWVAISFAAFVGVKIFIFSFAMSRDLQYYSVYLCAGFLVWMFIVQVFSEGCTTFLAAKSWILGIPAPYSLFLYQGMLRNIVSYLVTLIVALIIVYTVRPVPLPYVAVSFLSFLLLIFLMFWVQLFLAVLSVRIRDVVQLVNVFMRIMFFLTPILWIPSAVSAGARAFAQYNPFTHLLAIIREPLLGSMPTAVNWYVYLGLLAISIISSLGLYSLEYRRLAARL
ncbi:ABC transporter permease [Parvularcula flava]|uniref:ABC transporter permease n=1 Tax=Aquisalinus luteolus TaxID=1566827 RepID=A0A8J3A467_9PROT|nr:ABC transporter permease [Aquisalinus luteolus]NHK29513.1 ABC transporter permease [Aquisalinus luteolus]GGI01711.1 sugar ABC transporter permease [Aquisalinus luteolus]